MKERLLKGLKWFYRSYIWLGVVLLGLDIFTKQLIMHLPLIDDGLIADWGFVHIRYVLNDGAAFGMGFNKPEVNRVIYLIVASVISIALITYLIIKRKETKLFVRASLIMVVVGAIGNMIDRVFYGPLQGATGLFSGCVVDWIDFWWFWDYNFNIADSCIVIAAFMLIIYVIVAEVKEIMARRKAEAHDEKVLSKSEQERLDREQNNKEEDK